MPGAAAQRKLRDQRLTACPLLFTTKAAPGPACKATGKLQPDATRAGPPSQGWFTDATGGGLQLYVRGDVHITAHLTPGGICHLCHLWWEQLVSEGLVA